MFVLGKKGPKRGLGVALTLIQSNLKDCQESGIVEQKGKNTIRVITLGLRVTSTSNPTEAKLKTIILCFIQ